MKKNTCYVAYISYLIEKWMYNGETKEKILIRINVGKRNGRFPEKIDYIDSYLDNKYGSSGCAFLDHATGELIVGFAGTNYRSGILEGTKDILADAIRLGVTGMERGCDYLQRPQEFLDGLKGKGYKIAEATGHSLGGALAVYMGVYNSIPRVMTFNGAPLYVLPVGDKSCIDECVKQYNGRIIRYISSNDPLNLITEKTYGYYPGEVRIIEETEGHAMIHFIRNIVESESE